MTELINTGLVAAYPQRNLGQEYGVLVADAKVIDVTGYTLTAFSEQNKERFTERAKTKKPIKARILLVDPGSEASAIMAAAENKDISQYLASHRTLIKSLSGLKGIEIKLTKRPLSMMVYRIDDVLFTGPYPFTANSTTATTLKVGRGWLFDRQMKDFDELWKEATPYTLEEPQAIVAAAASPSTATPAA